MKQCHTFIIILSGCKSQSRRDNCRKTWLNQLSTDMQYKFIVGQGQLDDIQEGDILQFNNIPDKYNDSSKKYEKIIQWVCSNYECEWLVFVDDDTFVVPQRIKNIEDDNYDLIGCTPEICHQNNQKLLWGGAGIALKFDMAVKIANSSHLVNTAVCQLSDDWLLKIVKRLGGVIKQEKAFLPIYDTYYPTKENSIVTCHRLTDYDSMYYLYRQFVESENIVSKILVTHPEWIWQRGLIVCFKDKSFYLVSVQLTRNPVNIKVYKLHVDKGNYYYDKESECIVLDWYNWDNEAVSKKNNDKAINSKYKVLYTTNDKGFDKIVEFLTDNKSTE